MAAKKNAEATEQTVVADDHAQEAPEKRTKASLINEAMQHGLTEPKDIVDHLKKLYPDVDIEPTYVSVHKSNLKKREAKANGEVEAPRPATSRNVPPTNTSAVNLPTTFGSDIVKIKSLIETAGGTAELLDLVNDLISLHQRYGPALTKMIEAFGD